MTAVRALLQEAARSLQHSDTARLDAELLLAHLLEVDRTWLYTWPEQEVPAVVHTGFMALVERRQAGEPLAHIVGQREFWGLPFYCNSSTLIPRPDTEALVEKALSLALPHTARVLDLGTGTGAIALALASERPDWNILGVDRVAAAIDLAKKNQTRLGFSNLTWQVGDWFNGLEGDRFDLIVGNPPYVETDDEHLAQGDLRFEPVSALVSGTDGLDDIRAILKDAAAHLTPGGYLLLEQGASQGPAVMGLFAAAGLEEVAAVYDLGNRHRATCARNPRVRAENAG